MSEALGLFALVRFQAGCLGWPTPGSAVPLLKEEERGEREKFQVQDMFIVLVLIEFETCTRVKGKLNNKLVVIHILFIYPRTLAARSVRNLSGFCGLIADSSIAVSSTPVGTALQMRSLNRLFPPLSAPIMS